MSVENNLPKGWVETTLGEVSKVQTGPFGSQLLKEQYITGGTPVVTVEHIVDFRITDIEYPSVTDEDKKRLSKYLLKEGDIIFTRVGSVDLSAYVAKKQNGWMFSSRMLSVRTNSDVDSKFLSYFFRQNSFRKYIHRISVGATMPSINTNILKSIPISYPPKSEQQAIASILTTFDDKIELLQAQNETLEATAQTIFKEWFGKYQVGDELPEGWRVGMYQEIVYLSSGKGVKKSEYNDDGKYDIIGANGSLGKLDKFLINERIIVTGRVGTLGTVFIINKPVWISDNVLISKPKNNCLFHFVYFTLKGFNFTALNTGSTQPLITQGDLKSVDIIIPNETVLESFEKVSSKLFQKIEDNQNQIQTLQATRDTLLPKLMSGQLRVEGFKD